MIISHKHRFIFIAIPKTGTHAIREALRTHLGDDDWEQVALFEKKQFPFPEIAQLSHGHIGANQIEPYLDADIWNSYFKFAFVRNPWCRFISYCSFMTRKSRGFEKNPQQAMSFFLNDPATRGHILFRPQREFIVNEKGEIIVDFIGHTETIQTDYDFICEKTGIPSCKLDRVNSSKRSDYHRYYSNGLKQAVETLYREDIHLFDYSY